MKKAKNNKHLILNNAMETPLEMIQNQEMSLTVSSISGLLGFFTDGLLSSSPLPSLSLRFAGMMILKVDYY